MRVAIAVIARAVDTPSGGMRISGVVNGLPSPVFPVAVDATMFGLRFVFGPEDAAGPRSAAEAVLAHQARLQDDQVPGLDDIYRPAAGGLLGRPGISVVRRDLKDGEMQLLDAQAHSGEQGEWTG